jgi:hypothetical protein
MKSILFLICAGIIVVGCNPPADEGRELTTAEIQQNAQERLNDPNLPPQARAAMEASGRYGNQYSAEQQKKPGK